jgi:predicted O-methyltransferase YrrM
MRTIVRQDTSVSYLDATTPLQSHVGWGRLGTGGDLGYDGGRVTVGGIRYEHALSTHPPARVLYHLGGGAATLRCQVAINDDVPAGRSHADFAVVADGREIAHARRVLAGEPPRELVVDIAGVQMLELIVATASWDCAHAVWLDPQVDAVLGDGTPEAFLDCLGYAAIEPLPALGTTQRCIATVASPGFELLLDNMLGSVVANGGCTDALIVVFLLGGNPACERVIAKYRAVPIRCTPRRPLGRGSKAILYSVAQLVDAEQFLCLDADTVVLRELAPIFAATEACPAGSVLACREGNSRGYRNVADALGRAYGGEQEDFARILGQVGREPGYELVVNDGVFAGSRSALIALDATIRGMPGAGQWLDSRPHIGWRNQFIFNLALARLDCGVELDETNNIQLHTSDVDVDLDVAAARPSVRWQGRQVRIVHASATGRDKIPRLGNLYSSVSDPLAGPGDGDAYGKFLDALRAWIGCRGLLALEQSFYGTWEQPGSRVRDPSMMPVLALLHYLIRANGCVRVVETGTMNGVSAACIASALAHRRGGRVVSFDPFECPGRAELWASLPARMHAAIEPRSVDSIEGLRNALRAGEGYDAALLDSVHTEEHLWQEFELARRLVRGGGLILAHDWRWAEGVQRALARIEGAGFGVVRLLGPGGVEEDSGLGIALIENRLD